jgi:hypothetical protein
MKKVYFSLLVILAACIIGITGCRKNQESTKGSGAVLTAESLSKDEAFMKLNNAISRFDPKYLVLVYKDPRTTDEIVKASNDLLIQLKTDPESILYQKQLADFYHFSSVTQLKEYSAAITESLKKLDAKYDLQKTLFTGDEGSRLFNKARGLYAKDRLADNPGDARKKTTGLWSDFVDIYASDFGYNSSVYDQSLEPGGDDGGGGGEGCNESCCWERETCKKNARSKYFTNLWLYTIGGATSGGAAGAGSGSIVPFWGNIAGGIGGIIWGGSMGAITALNIYQNDQEACNSTYRACIQKKSGN